jgi:hypothetical protein
MCSSLQRKEFRKKQKNEKGKYFFLGRPVAEFGPGGPSDPRRALLTLSLGLTGRHCPPVSLSRGAQMSVAHVSFHSQLCELRSTSRYATHALATLVDALPSGDDSSISL